jgi:hypothetical protein
MIVNINLDQAYFSRYGSYFVINNDCGDEWNPPGLYLRCACGPKRMHHRIFRLALLDNHDESEFSVSATPEKLTMQNSQGKAEFCIHTETALRIRVTGTVLKMTLVFAKGMWQDAYSRAIQVEENAWNLHCFTTGRKYRLRQLNGDVVVDAPWKGLRADFMTVYLDGSKQTTEVSMVEHETEYRENLYLDNEKPFDDCVDDVTTEHAAWQSTCPKVPKEFVDTAKLAFYVNWATVARSGGHLKRNGMLMSKRGMSNVWSWDHCFNAWGHVHNNPKFALDQWLIMFDHQDEYGRLPDSINDLVIEWMCTKPPIHGWILSQLLSRMELLPVDELRPFYEKLEKWTNHWWNDMVLPHHSLPHYTHGNDSGWDNSTMFDTASCVCAPDLMAFLILQMDVCAEFADTLNQPDDARKWREKADSKLKLLVDHYWKEDRFVAFEGFSGEEIRCQSLITYVPLLLGNRLPENIRKSLVSGLKSKGFVAPFGLATESIKSPRFGRDKENGYWRGPIWAPSTLIILEGLKKCGEIELAKDLALHYCNMCRDNGFSENFDPITGQGLCDTPYTWTSSVFIILAHEYLLEKP